jgi:hypothetical protein
MTQCARNSPPSRSRVPLPPLWVAFPLHLAWYLSFRVQVVHNALPPSLPPLLRSITKSPSLSPSVAQCSFESLDFPLLVSWLPPSSCTGLRPRFFLHRCRHHGASRRPWHTRRHISMAATDAVYLFLLVVGTRLSLATSDVVMCLYVVCVWLFATSITAMDIGCVVCSDDYPLSSPRTCS